MLKLLAALAATLALAGPALAENRALILANETYRNAANIEAADAALAARAALEAAGFAARAEADRAAPEMRVALAGLLAEREAAERIVILLSGHFVKSERETWFLGVEANRPDLARADGVGLPLSTVLEIASGAPGGALVLLGSEERRIDLGTGLAPGIGALDIPQGVTVMSGDAAAVAGFAQRDLPRPGVSLAAMAAARPELTAQGFLSDLAPFLPRPASGSALDANAAERAVWEAARALDTPEAYDNYVARYPQGLFAAQARAEAARIRAEPGRQAQLAEEALALTRDQRREVQRDLSMIGIDPRGIDGVFGRGSRAAIQTWQERNGFPATGYLTGDQITRLAAQADRRAEELEAEARARQAEQDRLDRLYWEQTGAAGDEAGLRAYLRRYPDGLFAEVAQERLSVFDAARREEAAAQDRAAWDRATAANTAESYRGYLAAFPQGAFAEEAREMAAALEAGRNEADARVAAERAEAALNLNQVARNLVEVRLDSLGLRPGRVDGTFDEDTRRAIRRYQQARGLPVTGYMTEQVLVRLLADGVVRLGD